MLLARFGLATGYEVLFRVAEVTVHGPAAATTRGVPVTLRAGAADVVALPADEMDSPPRAPLALYTPSGDGWAAALTLGTILQADILRFTLVVQEGDDIPERWDDLQFNRGPGFWGDKLARLGDQGQPAGASAPEDVVQECIEYLQRRFGATIQEEWVREENVHFPLPRSLRELLPATVSSAERGSPVGDVVGARAAS